MVNECCFIHNINIISPANYDRNTFASSSFHRLGCFFNTKIVRFNIFFLCSVVSLIPSLSSSYTKINNDIPEFYTISGINISMALEHLSRNHRLQHTWRKFAKNLLRKLAAICSNGTKPLRKLTTSLRKPASSIFYTPRTRVVCCLSELKQHQSSWWS